jgi:hypothetical protein
LDRFLTNQTATRLFLTTGDLHGPVAERPNAHHGSGSVLDLGGGDGLLAQQLLRLGTRAVVLDQAAYVLTGPRPAVQGDAERLLFQDGSFDPDTMAVATFLRGRGLAAEVAEVEAVNFDVPMDVTKRGVLVWGPSP